MRTNLVSIEHGATNDKNRLDEDQGKENVHVQGRSVVSAVITGDLETRSPFESPCI